MNEIVIAGQEILSVATTKSRASRVLCWKSVGATLGKVEGVINLIRWSGRKGNGGKPTPCVAPIARLAACRSPLKEVGSEGPLFSKVRSTSYSRKKSRPDRYMIISTVCT